MAVLRLHQQPRVPPTDPQLIGDKEEAQSGQGDPSAPSRPLQSLTKRTGLVEEKREDDRDRRQEKARGVRPQGIAPTPARPAKVIAPTHEQQKGEREHHQQRDREGGEVVDLTGEDGRQGQCQQFLRRPLRSDQLPDQDEHHQRENDRNIGSTLEVRQPEITQKTSSSRGREAASRRCHTMSWVGTADRHIGSANTHGPQWRHRATSRRGPRSGPRSTDCRDQQTRQRQTSSPGPL